VNFYRFTDGTVHGLREVKISVEQHRHLHKKNPRPDCKFCNPLLAAERELLQEVPEPNPPEQPLVQEVVAEIEDESELTEFSAIASLAHAFSRINRNTK
jgi:hypothetical protein